MKNRVLVKTMKNYNKNLFKIQYSSFTIGLITVHFIKNISEGKVSSIRMSECRLLSKVLMFKNKNIVGIRTRNARTFNGIMGKYGSKVKNNTGCKSYIKMNIKVDSCGKVIFKINNKKNNMPNVNEFIVCVCMCVFKFSHSLNFIRNILF